VPDNDWDDLVERDGWFVCVCMIGLLSMIPAGGALAIYTGNPTWLWLCLPLILFLS